MKSLKPSPFTSSPLTLTAKFKFTASIVVGALLFGALLAWPLLLSCTPGQRSIVRSVVDATEQECPTAMTVEECLRRLGLALAPTASPSASPLLAPTVSPTASASAMVEP